MVMVSPLSLQMNGPDDSDEEADGVADKGSEEASEDTVSALILFCSVEMAHWLPLKWAAPDNTTLHIPCLFSVPQQLLLCLSSGWRCCWQRG